MNINELNFQRLVIRINLNESLTYSSSFTNSILLHWSNFLNLDLSSERVLTSFFIPNRNSFAFYGGNFSSSSFSLNITYSGSKIQQYFVENILLEDEVFFSSHKLAIDQMFIYKVPFLSSLSSSRDSQVTFTFTNPTFILSSAQDSNRFSLPSLSSIINSFLLRINHFLPEVDLKFLFKSLDLSSLEHSIRSYNFKSFYLDNKGISCLGNISFFFPFLPKELLYLFYLINVFGLGIFHENGFGWVNVSIREE